MTTILDLAMEQQVNQPAPTPVVTEKASINMMFKTSQLIMRFNSVKKAEKAYKLLLKSWKAWQDRQGPCLLELNADMFDATVDLSELVTASFIDLSKRQKFVAWQG